MNTLSKILSIALVSNFLLFFELEPCTRMFWNDNAQAKIVARTMDLFVSDEPQMWINPRGIHHKSNVDDNGLEWTSKYGSISITAFHVKDLTVDGINEHGLAVHALALQRTKYEDRNDSPGIHYGEWLQYLLDTCKTVNEVIDAHDNFQVVPIAVNGFSWPLHLMVEDATGDSVIVEFVDGKMNVHHSSDYKVGTNYPSYDRHLIKLENYEKSETTKSLPTGSDSTSRFIRASIFLKQLPEPKSTNEAIEIMRNTISRFFQKDNVSVNSGVNFMGKEISVSTLWTTILDLTHRTYYFFPIDQKNGICINLSEINFSKGSSVQVLNLFDPSFFENVQPECLSCH